MGEIRRFVQIDDYKRSLYMEARRTLQERFNNQGLAFICLELKDAVFSMAPAIDITAEKIEPLCERDRIFSNWIVLDFLRSIEKDFNDLFPELIELFDGYAYGVDGKWESAHLGDAWFGVGMIEARIALIDFILTQ